MKKYDLIIIGIGSATNLLDPLIKRNPRIKIAIIDKDETGDLPNERTVSLKFKVTCRRMKRAKERS